MDVTDFAIVPGPTEERLAPRQLVDYRNEREDCIEWLLAFGKNPETAEGYAETTIKARIYRMDYFYRFVWEEEGNYTTAVTHEHADAWMKELAYQDCSDAHRDCCQKAVMMLFKWRAHVRGGKKWEPQIRFSSGNKTTTPRDFLTREERNKVREASLEYGSIPRYNNVTPEVRARLKSYLAQRFEKPKKDVSRADWERANGWKIPSLVGASLDAGLRPIEVERAVTENRGESLALQRGDESDTSFHNPPVDGTTGYSTLAPIQAFKSVSLHGLRMAKQVVTRTYTASIRNQSRVQDDLDSLGFAASKLWNVGRWTCSRIWDEIDHIPNHNELTTYLKTHDRYADLHSQSSQRVLQELAEAFNGWYGKRQNGDLSANPPGYRKHGDEHPRSTVTFKAAGFKLDTKYDRVRLSKGSNLKDYWSDFILCKYQTRPDTDLSTVESVQQVRVVWTGSEWELHFVCKVEIEVAEAPGKKTVGVDLGINNFAALAYEDGHAELYPLNCLKQDDYYFSKRIARCDDPTSEQATRLNHKKSARRTHYFHTLSKHIVQRCVEEEVGTIVIGDLSGIREDEENDEAKDWGKHGNLDLHSWAFDRFTDLLEYKAEMEGITVEEVSERDTSKSCSCCGRKRRANRVERGLYVCDECGTTANADVNGAENIRQKVTPSPATDGVDELRCVSSAHQSASRSGDGDRSTGWLAQPSTFLFDKETGALAPQEQVPS